MTFTYWDRVVLLDHAYNVTSRTERGIEVPIALDFIGKGDGLEVGNVLSHYEPVVHRVVDRREVAPGVENLDVFDIEGSYDWIVSVSTLEHVRWDEEPKEDGGGERAIKHLRTLLNPGGRMLVTIPFGYNAPLDEAILAGLEVTRECSLIRQNGGWVQTPEVRSLPYGLSTRWAESVWFGEFG